MVDWYRDGEVRNTGLWVDCCHLEPWLRRRERETADTNGCCEQMQLKGHIKVVDDTNPFSLTNVAA